MFSETIELRGHIIDSLILPKVLDQILTHGANFKIGEIRIGKKRADQSFARMEVFQFINTIIDRDERKSAVIRELCRALQHVRKTNGNSAVVGGPAIVRTGAVDLLVRLIESRYVDRLFAGSALAVYDVERAL